MRFGPHQAPLSCSSPMAELWRWSGLLHRRRLLGNPPVALEAAHTLSAWGKECGGGEARAGPAATERVGTRLRYEMAARTAGLPCTSSALRLVRGPGPPGAGDGGRPRGATSWRPDAVLGRGQLG